MYQLSTARIDCPYCGEAIDILVDGSEPEQFYIEDCSVCCRPITLKVICDKEVIRQILAFRDDDC
ncbi:MAG: CPXCG motif-containing cysteine-rich protein [Candidatus Thiodiazotropha sp. (ex Notomyrtea botanica)]|nr:CPXCG motif-containing cysteine-rich protein [Candidatus Thiodiazotropha sp. (ex Notomyrtea botanica)]